MTTSLDDTTQAYVDAILSLPAFQQWRDAAFPESWVVDADEVDEEPIAVFRQTT